MDSIPVALRGVVKRFESVPNLSREELIKILFVIRLGDSLHSSYYATFLTLSLMEQLCEKLEISYLTVELGVFSTRWNFRQGTVDVVNRIGFDRDMYGVSVLSKIGGAVLEGSMTPSDGLRMIRDHENRTERMPLCSFYREYPGRGLVVPLMAATCSAVYFEGTWYDMGFSAATGLVSGLIVWLSSFSEQAAPIADYLAATVASSMSFAFMSSMPDATCYSAQILGTLFWFLYATTFLVSIYEITNSQVVTGVARFSMAFLRVFGVLIGTLLGLWIAGYQDGDLSTDLCDNKKGEISNYWFILFFPLFGVACLMQFRVNWARIPLCLVVQTIAYGLQYLIATVWKQQDVFAILVPSFGATLASHVCISIARWFRLAGLKVSRSDYLGKKTDNELSLAVPSSSSEDDDMPQSDKAKFVNEGWAEINAVGYARSDKLTYARSDVWFCLLPALYVLVPGSAIFRQGFLMELISGIDPNQPVFGSELGTLSSSLFVVGFGQVIGVRLGFVTLWIGASLWSFFKDHCFSDEKQRFRTTPSGSNPSIIPQGMMSKGSKSFNVHGNTAKLSPKPLEM